MESEMMGTVGLSTGGALESALILKTPGGKIIAPSWEAFAHLNKALAETMGDIKPVEKGDTNPFAKYKYASIGDVLQAVREVMAEHHVFLHTRMTDVKQENEGNNLRTNAPIECVLVDGETGAMIITNWYGESVDTGMCDKGIHKATAAAIKYFLLRTFMIPTVDDNEQEPDHGTRQQPRKADGKDGPQSWVDKATRNQLAILIAELAKGQGMTVDNNKIAEISHAALGGKLEDYAKAHSFEDAKADIATYFENAKREATNVQ